MFSKMCKSYLKLSKEFRGTSYNSMLAHTSIVMIRYMILSVENRENNDIRSIGELFFVTCDKLQDVTFSEPLVLIIAALLETLQSMIFITKDQIDKMLGIFISKLPYFLIKKIPNRKSI